MTKRIPNPLQIRCSRTPVGMLGVAALAVSLHGARAFAQGVAETRVPPPDSPAPFSSIPVALLLVLLVVYGALGVVRAVLPSSWQGAPWRWTRSIFDHSMRIGWLAFAPALVLDALVLFMGEEYSRGWALAGLTFAFAPFAAGVQWEKARWNTRKNREDPYPPAVNYYLGIALVALVPAIAVEWVLHWFQQAGRLYLTTLPFNLVVVCALGGSLAFLATKLLIVLLRAAVLPHRTIAFFIDPSSRFYALSTVIPIVCMLVFHYFTLPFFFETFSYTLPPVPAATIDQALAILVPNVITVVLVTYFSLFAGMFVAMLPILLFSGSLRRDVQRPPTLDELLADRAASRQYLGRELTREELWPVVATITAYNEPCEPLEKTLCGYLQVAKGWVERGLPHDRFIILFSHQTEREDDRVEFEEFVRERFPDYDPASLIDRDWSRFDEDDPDPSIRNEERLADVLRAWVEKKGLDPESKAGKDEYQKRRVCQRLYEFSCQAPRELFGLPDPPERMYGPQKVEGWIWYFLIPKQVGGRAIQVTSKAHNLLYAREGIWGRKETSSLARDGIFKDAPEWLFDASDADCEIHPSCVEGILATYTPFYRESGLAWIQRLSYTIEPEATFLSRVKSASENAYWSWYLRARVHTYTKGGKPLFRRFGDSVRPVRRDFQAANGHNMVVRGTSVRRAGGDVEHETVDYHEIQSPVKRWITAWRGRPVGKARKRIEKWVPTGEDLELATRMALNGEYGDYASYAPQGEGSPADFRGNVPQAIRWSGNNVQLIFMHLAKVFSTPRWTFNEKMGYFVNLATLASAPLLYLTVIRAALMPFLGIPDVYGSIHPGLGPIGFLLALAPNFLLLALALTGQLVVMPTEPWQRSVLKAWQQKLLLWSGCLLLPPLTILGAAFLPGWLESAGIHMEPATGWTLLAIAIVFNIVALLHRPQIYSGLAYCVILIPFLQVLYLAWIIFGIMGTLNMIVKTQIVEPYISRLAGTFYPPQTNVYPADASGRFLPMTARFPWLFLPCRWIRDYPQVPALVFGALAGAGFWTRPPTGWPPEFAAGLGFFLGSIWLWRWLPGLMSDWFLDRDCLINRWWDYWTNPQPAFVKTIKERQERSLSTILKDNVFGMVNGLFILALIVHVHFVNASDFSAALLAYLTFSIGASWVISPFFYEEPHRSSRSQGRAVGIAIVAVLAFFAVPLLPRLLKEFFGMEVVPEVVRPWLQALFGVVALGALVNATPWEKARAFFKRTALSLVTLALLFLNALAVSYRGVAVEPLQERWVLEAERAFAAAVHERETIRPLLEDLEVEAGEAERNWQLALIRERLVQEYREDVAEDRDAAQEGLRVATENLRRAEAGLEVERSRAAFRKEIESLFESRGGPREPRTPREARVLLDALVERADAELERRERELTVAEGTRDELKLREESPDDVAEFEGSVIQRLLKSRDAAAEFRARVRNARSLYLAESEPAERGGTPEAFDLSELEILPMGELHEAREYVRRREDEVEAAERHLKIVSAQLAEADDALGSSSAARQAAADEKEALSARHTVALLQVEKPSTMRREAARRATRVFRLTPERYQGIQKFLSLYRPVLENDASRDRLIEALEEVSAVHWVKRLTLEGAPWYPKDTLLRLLRPEAELEAELRRAEAGRLPVDEELLAELKSLPAKMRLYQKVEDDYSDALVAAKRLIADTCTGYALRVLARLAQGAPLRLAHADAARNLEALLDETPSLRFDEEKIVEALADVEPARELVSLESQWPALERSGQATRAAWSARAALESAVNLRSELADDPAAEMRRWTELGLAAEHAGALAGQRLSLRRTRLETEAGQLTVWLDAVDSAIAQRQPERIAALFSTLSSDAFPPGDLVVRFKGASDIRIALDLVMEDNEKALDTRTELEELEDLILRDVDGLEPYLIGSVSEDQLSEPLPLPAALLLHKERARLNRELEAAHAALATFAEAAHLRRKGEITRELEPRRDRLEGQLIGALMRARQEAAGRAPAPRADAPAGEAADPLQRELDAAVAEARALFGSAAFAAPAGAAGGSPEASRAPLEGLIPLLETRASQAALAKKEADRSPREISFQQAMYQKERDADAVRADVEKAWDELGRRLAAAETIDRELWDAASRRALAGVLDDLDLSELASATVTRQLESVGPEDILRERIRVTTESIDAIQAKDLEPARLVSLIADPFSDWSHLEQRRAVLINRLDRLRRDVATLEASPAEEFSKRLFERSAPTGAAVTSPAPEDAGAPADEATVEIVAGLEEALEHARRPGGLVFSTEKDVEIARERIKAASFQLLPEAFATAGASSAASSVGQAGGFAVVTLSLDKWETERFFEEEAREREFLRTLAEFVTALKFLRASGDVLAAEIRLDLYRRELGETVALVDGARGSPGRGPSGDDWLALAAERLRSPVARLEVDLAARRRALNRLLGRPAGAPCRVEVQAVTSPDDARARIDDWLTRAGQLLSGRFPVHPALEASAAGLRKHATSIREADRRRFWPVLTAGAGAAAPADQVGSIGGSLIVPLLDRSAELKKATAINEQTVLEHGEELRFFEELRKSRLAEIRRSTAADRLRREEALAAAYGETLAEALLEYNHGFDGRASAVESEARALAASRVAVGSSCEEYLQSGLRLVETGVSLGSGESSNGPRSTPPRAVRPLNLAQAVEAAVQSAPSIRLEAPRGRSARQKLANEKELWRRVGVGASASYSGVFLPLPGFEMTYGYSGHRRAAAEAAVASAAARAAAARVEIQRSVLDAHVDWLRDSAIEATLLRKAELSDEARGWMEEQVGGGAASPAQGKLAAAHAAAVRRDAEAATDQRELTEAGYRLLVGSAPRADDFELHGKTLRALIDDVDRAVRPDAPELAGYREAVARTAVQAAEESSWRDLVAQLESKRPYGGLIGNLITPLWDTVRLWRRPGTPGEVKAALDELKEFLLEHDQGGLTREEAREALREALDRTKGVLGGDGYDLDEMGESIRIWRQAASALELYDKEVTVKRELAELEYRLSHVELERIPRRVARLREDVRAFESEGAPPFVRRERGFQFRELIEDIKVDMARALYRYARARAEQIYYGNDLDVSPPPDVEKEMTVPELIRAYVERDRGVLAARSLAVSRGTELQLVESMYPVRATAPTVYPAVGVDPRFGGSSMSTGLGVFLNLDRSRLLDTLAGELTATSEEIEARELEARLAALQDLSTLRLARERVAAWTKEAATRRGEHRRVQSEVRRGERSGEDLQKATRAVTAAESELAEAEIDVRRAEDEVLVRAGGRPPAEFDEEDPLLLAAPGAAVEPSPPEDWRESVRESDSDARAMSSRAAGERAAEVWREKETWLGTRLELVGSVGTEPDNTDGGAGGFLAFPLHRLLDWGRTGKRIAALAAEKHEGAAERLAELAEQRVEELYLALDENAQLAGQALREATIAEAAYRSEQRSSADGRLAPGDSELAAERYLSALSGYLERRGRLRLGARELEARLAAAGVAETGPLVALPEPPIDWTPRPMVAERLAAELVEDATTLPRESAYRIEETSIEREVIAGALTRIDGLAPLDVVRQVDARRALEVLEGLPDLTASLKRRVGELLAIIENPPADGAARGGTPADAWERLIPRILQTASAVDALRETLRQQLEAERQQLEAESASRQEESADPGVSVGAVRDRITPEVFEAALAAALNAAPVPFDEAGRLREQVERLADDLEATRRAKIRDAIVRFRYGDSNQTMLREEIRAIDLHGRYGRAVIDMAKLLRGLAGASPELCRRFVLALRETQRDLVEEELAREDRLRPPALLATDPRVGLRVGAHEVLTFFGDTLPPEDQPRIRRLIDLRERLRAALVDRALGQEQSRQERDIVARNLGATRVDAARREEERTRLALEKAARSFLGDPDVGALLPGAASAWRDAQLEQLEKEREQLSRRTAENEQAARTEPLPLEVALGSLQRTLAKNPQIETPDPRRVERVEEALEELRRAAVSYRAAVQRRSDRNFGPSSSGASAVTALQAFRERGADLRAAWARLLGGEDDGAGGDGRGADRTSGDPALATAGDGEAGVHPAAASRASLESAWREEMAREVAAQRFAREKASARLPDLIAEVLERLRAPDSAARQAARAKLLGSFPPDLPRLRSRLEEILNQLEVSTHLRNFAWELQRFYHDREQRDPLEAYVEKWGEELVAKGLGVSTERLGAILAEPPADRDIQVSLASVEEILRTAAAGEGRAEAALRNFVAEFAAPPERFVALMERAELLPPTLFERYERLRAAQSRLAGEQEAGREAEVDLIAVRASARDARAWAEVDREVEELRRDDVYKELMEARHARLMKRGFVDSRERLTSLSRILAQDRERAGRAAEGLTEIRRQSALSHVVTREEVTDFLDLQLTERIEKPVQAVSERLRSADIEIPVSVRYARTYSGREEAYTFEQALQAIVYLLLPQGWRSGENVKAESIAKAESILTQFLLYLETARALGTEYRGHPRMFLASRGAPGDTKIDASSNAAICLAAQLHAAETGRDRFVGLASGITREVLVPLIREEAGSTTLSARGAVLVSSQLRATALTIAALRNQSRIAAALGDERDSRLYERYAEGLSRWLMEECWDPARGVFRFKQDSRLDLEGNLFCLAVLGHADRPDFRPRYLEEAADGLKSFETSDALHELVDKGDFRGNWFLEGPVKAYNNFVVAFTTYESGEEARELNASDAWLFTNNLLFRWSDGHLGFRVIVRGLALDDDRLQVDFAGTAQAVWLLRTLSARAERKSQEQAARAIEALADEYHGELSMCSVAAQDDPRSRSWPLRMSERDATRHPEQAKLRGLLSTKAACFWTLAELAGTGVEPLLPADFSKLEDSLDGARGAPPAPAPGRRADDLARLQGELRRLETELRKRMADQEARGGETAAASSPTTDPVLLPLGWLEGQVHPRTGLLRANEDDRFACHPYTTALAVIHLSLAGARQGGAHLDAARALWKDMQEVRRREGAWSDAYDARTGQTLADSRKLATSQNSWMVLAGIHLYRATGERAILEQARATLDWVLSCQIVDPGHPHHRAVTLHPAPARESFSTEANLDALAAAWGMAQALGDGGGSPYRNAAADIAAWLTGVMWLDKASPKHFASGTDKDGSPELRDQWLDSQTWTLLALHATAGALGVEAAAFDGLPVLDDRVSVVPFAGGRLHGFSKITLGPSAFWPEGVAGYVLAARRAGRLAAAATCWSSLEAVRGADGTLPHIIGTVRDGRWEFDHRVKAVDGTIWTAWADPSVNFNPFLTSESAPTARRAEHQARPAESGPATPSEERARMEEALRDLRRQVEELRARLSGQGERAEQLPAREESGGPR